MKIRAIIIATLTLGLAPLGACASDVEDLQARLAEINQAYNELDAKTICEGMHEDIVYFDVASMYPAHGKKAACGALHGFLSSMEQANLQLRGTKIQIVGSTGIVSGHWQFLYKQKDDGLEVHTGRWLGAYQKSDGKWLQTAFSATEIAPATGAQ